MTVMTIGACVSCGFDPAELGPPAVGDEIGRRVAECRALVAAAASDEALRRRAADLSWSPVEYVGHLRDVLALFADRARLILAADRPDLPVVDHDQLVRDGGYQQLDPGELADDLAARADELLAVLREVDGAAWQRVGYRAGEERSVLEIAQRAAHEVRHHTADIARCLEVNDPRGAG